MTETELQEREGERRRRTALLLLPAGLLASLFCVWTLFANVGRGEAKAFIPAPLHSSARANYADDGLLGGMQSLSISIIESAIRDQDPQADDAGARATEVYESLQTAVPTVPGAPTAAATLVPTSTQTPVPAASDTPASSLTPIPSATATPTASPTPSIGPSKTPTTSKTSTPTVCKVPPVIRIISPDGGSVYSTTGELPGQALAYDPDNASPSNCATVAPEPDGLGIVRAEFKIDRWSGSGWVEVHSQIQYSAAYCAFQGALFCNIWDLSSGN